MSRQNHKNSFRLFLALALLLPGATFAAYYWYQNNLEGLPYYGKDYTIESARIRNHYTVPGFRFTNQDNKPVTMSDMGGDIKIVNFFFTTCKTICPVMMTNMRALQTAFPDGKLRILSLTVDPQDDSASVLKDYSMRLGLKPEIWTLATGDKKAIYSFARNGVFLSATQGDGGPDDFIHSDKLVLMDKTNHIRGYYDGTSKKDIQQLIKDIKRIK